MGYDSTINFTLDTICPWTYLARRRLSKALDQVRATHPPVKFTVHYLPYQLHPSLPPSGEPKAAWYLRTMHNNSEDQARKYALVMSAHGVGEGIDFRFGGTIANTLDAHRVLQHYQETKGEECAERIIESLYAQYFEQERSPSSRSTLLTATTAAGIPEAEAAAVIDDDSEGLAEVRALMREQAGNGVDAVPYVVLEGKRRDLTLQGCKEVGEYVKALEQIVKESK